MGDWTPGSDLLKQLNPFGAFDAAEQVSRAIANPFGLRTKEQKAEDELAEYNRQQQALADERLANDIADKVSKRYRSPVGGTTINYYTNPINPSANQPTSLPLPPQQKLKPIAVSPDTHPYRDAKQPVITVEKSLQSRSFGGLLHEPVSGAEVSIIGWETKGTLQAVEKASINAQKNLTEWAQGRQDIKEESMSLLFVDSFDTKNGGIKSFPIYGSDAIALLYASYRARSLNTGIPAITAIPKEIKVNRNKSSANSVDRAEVPLGFVPGSESFEEISVPEALIDSKSKKIKSLKSSGQAIAFLIQFLDALVGEFPLKIKVEDEALGRSGNQSVDITIPNLSEGIAEIFGLLFNTNQHGQLNTIINTKALTVASQNLISANVSQDVTLAIADYLGFKLAEIERKITLPIDPTKDKVSELLKNSEQKYKSYDFQDDKNLQHHLVRFNDAASIIKGALFKRFDNNNLDKEVRDYLKSLVGDGLGDTNSNWREFLNQVEEGFSNAKVIDKDKPYGLDRTRRPLIKDLTHGNSAK